MYLHEEDKKLASKLAASEEKPPLILTNRYCLEQPLKFGEFTRFIYLRDVSEEYGQTREDQLRTTTFCDFPEQINSLAKTKTINKFVKHWREDRVSSIRSDQPGWCEAILGADICTAPNYRVKHRIVASDESGGFGDRYKMVYMTKHSIPSENNKGTPTYFPYSGIGIYSYKALSSVAAIWEFSNNSMVEDCGTLNFLETSVDVFVKPLFNFKVSAYDYSPEECAKRSLLDRVSRAWEKYPTLRFVQLVLNAALYQVGVSCPEAFYLEDNRFRKKIEECLPK